MSSTPNDAISVFLDGIVDYAGLFPPAQHDLDEALRRYFIYRSGPFSWMLGPFVIALRQIEELLASDRLQRDSISLSVILPQDDTDAAWGDHLATCFGALRTWTRDSGGRIGVDAVETRLPVDYDTEVLEREVVHALSVALDPPTSIYIEIPPGDVETTEARVGAVAQARTTTAHDVGAKIRTGGLAPGDFPSREALAFFIAACRDAGLPFKATAGIHHPLRHTDASGQARHGFVNVIAAGILAREHEVGVTVVEDVLADESAGSFEFTPDAFWWRTWAVSAGAVARHRGEFVRSIGSCSFEDPVNDLIGLGHLVDPTGSEWTAATRPAPSGAG